MAGASKLNNADSQQQSVSRECSFVRNIRLLFRRLTVHVTPPDLRLSFASAFFRRLVHDIHLLKLQYFNIFLKARIEKNIRSYLMIKDTFYFAHLYFFRSQIFPICVSYEYRFFFFFLRTRRNKSFVVIIFSLEEQGLWGSPSENAR